MSEHLPGVDVIFRDDTWRQNRDRMDYLVDADGKTIILVVFSIKDHRIGNLTIHVLSQYLSHHL